MTAPGPAPAARPMRADARRNCERILAAAREVFAEHGTDAPLDDIAKRAKVGAGTLYRHFPNRESLIETVYREELLAMGERAYQLLAELPPTEALHQWVREQLTWVTERHGLAAALKAAMDRDAEVFEYCKNVMRAAAESVLAPLRDTGEIRADVTASDLLRLCHGIGVVVEGLPAEDVDRMLSVLLNGLRPA